MCLWISWISTLLFSLSFYVLFLIVITLSLCPPLVGFQLHVIWYMYFCHIDMLYSLFFSIWIEYFLLIFFHVHWLFFPSSPWQLLLSLAGIIFISVIVLFSSRISIWLCYIFSSVCAFVLFAIYSLMLSTFCFRLLMLCYF